jgi:HAE1 family hydrophobic/amphiphilic exporter-1
MALTLAVGFVVDDAVVMVENIVRHSEAGLSPMQAALKGAREITFTIISMTLSLVAVFIPVFFMGGVIGRVFNEFAVVIGLAILISGFVSLTLTPMLCSRFLRAPDPTARPGAFLRALERGYTAMLRGYEWSLELTLRHPRFILGVTVLTIALTGYLFYAIPKGSSRSKIPVTSRWGPRLRRTPRSPGWWRSSSKSMPSFGQPPCRVLQQRGRAGRAPEWE